MHSVYKCVTLHAVRDQLSLYAYVTSDTSSVVYCVSAVTVQFDGMEKDLKCRPLQRHSSTKMSSAELSVGERIDPAVPLESQLWVEHTADAWWRLCCSSSLMSVVLCSTAGITAPSAGQTPRLCCACVKRPVTWWGTARPVRTTSRSRSSKKLIVTHTDYATSILRLSKYIASLSWNDSELAFRNSRTVLASSFWHTGTSTCNNRSYSLKG